MTTLAMVPSDNMEPDIAIEVPPKRRHWLGGWIYQETQVELFIASIFLLWTMHLARSPYSVASEPVAKAMYQVSGLHPPALMWLMLAFAMLIAFGAYTMCTWFRRGMLFASLLFFCFITLSFWRWVPHYPGAFICISYVMFSLIRLMQMFGRRPE